MSINFTKNAVSIDIRDYEPAFDKIPNPGTVVGETAGGTVIAQKLGVATAKWYLNFNGLSKTTFDALYSFYYTTLQGAYVTFTFTDRDLTAYTVRWWNAFELKHHDHPSVDLAYGGRIVLREE